MMTAVLTAHRGWSAFERDRWLGITVKEEDRNMKRKQIVVMVYIVLLVSILL
ncbi:MAG: hypothetical protein Q4D94_12655 [Bacillota bacterium]|nr:hypothetical protein [Bacillota bacterium]